jgi:tRNA threonylcarbamoyladenosine modification (KEOPS) complex Cgi121 subunit
MALLDFQAETPKKYYKLNDTFVCLIGVQTIEVAEVSDFVRTLQKLSLAGVIIQTINARAAYGISHLLGVLKISLECQKRNITVSTKPEIDLLLRLSLTTQISFALNYAGLNILYPAIIIIYSTDKKRVADVRKRIMKTNPNIDSNVLRTNIESRDHIFRLFRANERTHILLRDDGYITQYLVERSALIMK